MLLALLPNLGLAGGDGVVTPVVTVPAKVGGDDVPWRKTPHRGWDEERAKLKLTEEQKFMAEIRAMYRQLTRNEETREQAEEIVRTELAPKAKPNVQERNQPKRSQMLKERMDRVSQLSVDTQIALHLLYDELLELQEREDEMMIAQLLARIV